MVLRIVKGTEPVRVDRLNVCLYGGPGLGKTSLAFTAADPLLIDFDHGSHRAAIRKDSVLVEAWKDVAAVATQDLASYKTVIVDTAGKALDFLAIDIINGNPKLARGDGALTQQGFGSLKSRFTQWLKLINSMGLDTVMLAHMDEQRSGDDIIERLDVTGGSKAEIYKAADLMGRLMLNARGERVIDFSPRPNSFGKNPAEFDVLPFPHPRQAGDTLAQIITQTKEHLNHLSAEQEKEQKATEEWNKILAGLTTLNDFNLTLKEFRSKAPKSVQERYKKLAKSKGFTFDKKHDLYVAEEPKKEEAHA